MNKRILSLVLALVMVLGTFGTVFAASYDDVTGTDVATAVDRLSTLGILTGYPDGTFKPANTITRAEFAAVAARAKGLEAVAQAAKGLPTGFTDVVGAHWASGYVGTAARLGIVNGIGNGQFAPEAPVKYEEAVTMIVRALGYEAAAQAKGGYPYGYLIVANENGLLDAVKGTQGVAATRGLVAQLTDNALEIPMMIQVGFGTDVKWVVSGTENTKEVTLLDSMGFDAVEGRVTKVDTKRATVTVDKKVLDVAEGFDYYAVEGVTIKAWVNGDDLVAYTVKDEVKFDATAKKDDNEIKLVGENANYDVVKNAKLVLDGEEVEVEEFISDYAKIVLNDDGEIVWAEGYTFNGFLAVEEVEDGIAIAYDEYDELDLEDFLIVKEGKTIKAEDIAEGDILFFNDDEFAVVYNNSKLGEIERVYDTEFRFEGKVYTTEGLFLEDGELGTLNETVLANMMAEEADVEVFFNYRGKVVLVVGDQGKAATTSFYAVLDKDAVIYDGRRGEMLALDLINQEGKKVSYDLTEEFVKGANKFTGVNFGTAAGVIAKDGTKLDANNVLKVTVDEDGKVTKVERLTPHELTIQAAGKTYAFKSDDTYAKVAGDSYRLQDSTIIFYDLDTTKEKVVKLGDVKDEFTTVKTGQVFELNGRAIVVVADSTDADDDTTAKTGLVTKVRKLDTAAYEFTFADGNRYTTESKTLSVTAATYEKQVVKLVVGNKTEKVEGFNIVEPVPAFSVAKVNTSTKTINDVYELTSDAKVYDITGTSVKTINLRDLEVGDTVKVYRDGSSSRFVSFVVRTALAEEADGNVTAATITYPTTAVKAGADKVVKVALPVNNTVVYKVGLYDSTGEIVGSLKSTVITAEYTATELGITTPGAAAATYVVRVYKVVGADNVEVSSKVINNTIVQ